MAKTNDFMLKADRDLLAARFEERHLKWARTRRRGMLFYVLVWWTLRLGGLLSAWFVFSEIYLHPRDHLHGARLILFFAAVFVVATLVGLWDWHSNEKRYRKAQEATRSK